MWRRSTCCRIQRSWICRATRERQKLFDRASVFVISTDHCGLLRLLHRLSSPPSTFADSSDSHLQRLSSCLE
ncbi:hypothetical protein QJS10_CPB04g00411 [Acorus calamus]|uniref:Uncharacterized protein n=1 Tax=Acorus calamus TaxID=4465 RepID=A0AAV9F2Z1_ACOCL|nr:hypothetical protein QJS10_CPB04g00411 [Acorus calamus]